MIDVYVLAPERSAAVVQRFRAAWLGGFEPAAEEYEVPQYADEPEAVFATPEEAIEWLLARPDEPHALYWHGPRGGEVANGMLFFTEDGGLIAGLSVREEGPALAGRLRSLADSVGAGYGYVVFEAAPPATAEEFRRAAAASDPPRLVDGRLET